MVIFSREIDGWTGRVFAPDGQQSFPHRAPALRNCGGPRLDGRASDGRAVAATMLFVEVTRQRGQADHQEDRALFGQQFGARAEEVLLYGQRRLA